MSKGQEGEITMKNTNEVITYWKNLTSGMMYKYYGTAKPLNWATDWKQVTAYDFDEFMAYWLKRLDEIR